MRRLAWPLHGSLPRTVALHACTCVVRLRLPPSIALLQCCSGAPLSLVPCLCACNDAPAPANRYSILHLRLPCPYPQAALPRFDAPSISALCVALARANYRPRAAFVRALLAQSARQLPYADASGALQVLWALRHMGLYSEVDGSGCLPPGWRAAFLDCTYELMQVTLRSYPPPPRRHRFHLAYSLALEPPPVRLGASRESQGSSTSSGGSGGGSSGQTQEPATTPGKQRSGTGKNVKPSGGSRSSAAANSSSAAASGTARAPKAPTVAPAPAPIPAGRGGSAARRARGFSPSQLSLLLLLVGKAGVRPGPNWRHAFWATSFAALPHMGPGALATLLQGVLRLRVVPPRWWQRAYFTASAEAMPRSSVSAKRG